MKFNLVDQFCAGFLLVCGHHSMVQAAELERSMIRERTKAGLARAKQQCRVGGRPKALTIAQRVEVVRMKESGRSIKEIANLFKVSISTIKRVSNA